MFSLRQSMTAMGKDPSLGVRDVLPCRSLHDSLTAWNHIPYALVMIAPRDFIATATPLAEFKNQTGMSATLLSLDHIYESYAGRDEAEKVKRCLALYQPNCGVKYAMLLGDEDVFPVRYTKWSNPLHPKDHDVIYIPVDLYYACLTRSDGTFDDWDANQNGYFGEAPADTSADPVNPDRVSVSPQLAIGRIPASSTAELDVYVAKVKSYETNAPGAAWRKSALLLATTTWIPDACGYQESFANAYLTPAGYTVYRLYEPGGLCLDGSACPATVPATADNINARVNSGAGFMAYIGHGGPGGWGTNAGYGVADVGNLANADKLPIVFAAACQTGEFAPLPPQCGYCDVNGTQHLGTDNGEAFSSAPPQPACIQTKDYESMAEAMTVMKSTGAIGYCGATVTAAFPDLDMVRYFFEAIQLGSATLGDIWLHMLKKYYQMHAPPAPDTPANTVAEAFGYFLQPWRFGLFGDPSLRVAGNSG